MHTIQNRGHNTLVVQSKSNLCWNGLCFEPPLENRKTVLRSLDSACCSISFPCSISNDHTEIRCFGNHRQAKRCVRYRKLGTIFGPANPVPCELRDPLFPIVRKRTTLLVVLMLNPYVRKVCKISQGHCGHQQYCSRSSGDEHHLYR